MGSARRPGTSTRRDDGRDRQLLALARRRCGRATGSAPATSSVSSRTSRPRRSPPGSPGRGSPTGNGATPWPTSAPPCTSPPSSVIPTFVISSWAPTPGPVRPPSPSEPRSRATLADVPGRRRPRDVHLVCRPGPPRPARAEPGGRRRRDGGAHRRAGRRRWWPPAARVLAVHHRHRAPAGRHRPGGPLVRRAGRARARGTNWPPTDGIRAGRSVSSPRPDSFTPTAAGSTPRSRPGRSTSPSASTSRRRSWPSGRGTSSSSKRRTRSAACWPTPSGEPRPGPTGTGSATVSPSFRSADWTRSN